MNPRNNESQEPNPDSSQPTEDPPYSPLDPDFVWRNILDNARRRSVFFIEENEGYRIYYQRRRLQQQRLEAEEFAKRQAEIREKKSQQSTSQQADDDKPSTSRQTETVEVEEEGKVVITGLDPQSSSRHTTPANREQPWEANRSTAVQDRQPTSSNRPRGSEPRAPIKRWTFGRFFRPREPAEKEKVKRSTLELDCYEPKPEEKLWLDRKQRLTRIDEDSSTDRQKDSKDKKDKDANSPAEYTAQKKLRGPIRAFDDDVSSSDSEEFLINYLSTAPSLRSHSSVNSFNKRGGLSGRGAISEDHEPMAKMNTLDEHERKIIIEFCHLLEKSKQLFNGLRELPHYGHKQWHAYFGRTFDVYTKLWKFQQQHRIILDTKYGLKRWQIGEIASKIGQLYYHFYLRSSETVYLNEAFSFYFAIRGRCYYTKANKEDKCELMVKKLRYYARFIVVGLLLRKLKVVRELVKELERQIVEYGATYDPDDQLEWVVVVDEVKAFIHAEPVVVIMNQDNYPVILSHRLTSLSIPPVERSSLMTLTLQEAVIVGSTSKQVKFSEMTMDMFRMLHTLERETSETPQHLFDESPRQRFLSTPSVPNAKGFLENGPLSDNPHKNLLYKPSPMQVLTYLSSGCQDLPPNGVMLLYISADGQLAQHNKHPDDVGYDAGGVTTAMKNDAYRDGRDGRDHRDSRDGRDLRDSVGADGRDQRDELDLRDVLYMRDGRDLRDCRHPRDGHDFRDVRNGRRDDLRDTRYPRAGRDLRDGRGQDSKAGPNASKHKENQCLHPGDLFPFTRHPLFMIVDSDNSHVFQNVPRQFGQPLVVLMSPLELPSPMQERKHQGSLFTLFLTGPLLGLCAICDLQTEFESHWTRATTLLNSFMAEASVIFTRNRNIDVQFIAFFGDDFLRLLMLRFVFCEVALRLHRSFRTRNQLTRSSPALPEDLFGHPTLVHIMLDLTSHFQIRGHFHDPTSGPPAAKE